MLIQITDSQVLAQFDRALIRLHLSQRHLQQGALARAIGAGDAQKAAAIQVKG